MNAIRAQLRFEATFVVGHGRVVVHVYETNFRGVILHPGVKRPDLRSRLETLVPMKIARRQYGAQDNTNAIRSGKLAHGGDVVANLLDRFLSGVLGYVICTGQQDNYFGLQENDVLAKTYQHLWCSLPGNTAIDIGLSGKKLATAGRSWRRLHSPAFGDGI